MSDRGFIYVSTVKRIYYEFAIESAKSLRDFYPDAHITLFSNQKFVDKRAEIFDNVITNVPIHHRAKMWCMARTPYEQTVYNDVDTLIMSKEIRTFFDYLDTHDMMFGPTLDYTVANMKWAYMDRAQTIQPKYHGSLCVYNKTDLTMDFMNTWWEKYLEQQNNPWKYSWAYPEWQQFDMFTLWRMTSGRFKEFERFKQLNIGMLERRLNSTVQDLDADLKGRRCIVQIDTSSYKKMEIFKRVMERNINDENYKLELPKDYKTAKYYN